MVARKKTPQVSPRVEGATVSNCHVEQGTVHVHHDEHTATAVVAVARALEQHGRALEALAQTISGKEVRPQISGYGIAMGCEAPRNTGAGVRVGTPDP